MRLIHLDVFRVVHVPFVRRVKFKHLAHFSLVLLAHPVMFSSILSWRQFTALALLSLLLISFFQDFIPVLPGGFY